MGGKLVDAWCLQQLATRPEPTRQRAHAGPRRQRAAAAAADRLCDQGSGLLMVEVAELCLAGRCVLNLPLEIHLHVPRRVAPPPCPAGAFLFFSFSFSFPVRNCQVKPRWEGGLCCATAVAQCSLLCMRSELRRRVKKSCWWWVEVVALLFVQSALKSIFSVSIVSGFLFELTQNF